MTAQSIVEAAQALGVRPGTLKRWCRQGAPVVQRGRRGRGCALLVDPAAVRQWLGADARDALLLELANELPYAMADAAIEALRLVEGPHKRSTAGVLAGTWYLSAAAVLDLLRDRCPSIPEIGAIPEPIERLRKIARND